MRKKKTSTKDSHPPPSTEKPTFLILRDSGIREASDIKKRNSRGTTKTKPSKVTAEPGSSKKF